MSTFTQLLYHIVFSTKNREMTLTANERPMIFKYIWNIIEKKQSHPYYINGVEDHLHIATHIHPTFPVSTLIKDIKLASTSFIKDEELLRRLARWLRRLYPFIQ